jgi:hypothetical protein
LQNASDVEWYEIFRQRVVQNACIIDGGLLPFFLAVRKRRLSRWSS